MQVIIYKRISLKSFSRITAEEAYAKCFMNITELVNLMFIIPMNTTVYKCGFSSPYQIKIFLHSTFKKKVLDDLMNVIKVLFTSLNLETHDIMSRKKKS